MNLILEVLLRATVVSILGVIVYWLTAKRAPKARVTVLRTTLVLLALVPILVAFGPKVVQETHLLGISKQVPSVTFEVALPLDEPIVSAPVEVPPAPRDFSWLYLVGTIALFLPLLLGNTLVRRMWHRADFAEPEIRDEFHSQARHLGVRQKISMRIGQLVSPMLFGFVKPRLLLPPTFDEWPQNHRKFALLHEAAHISSFDCAWQVVANCVRALYWCHPVVWYLTRVLAEETELAADEKAIKVGANPSDYAMALVDIARQAKQPNRLVVSHGLSFMNSKQLDRRVRRAIGGSRSGFTTSGSLFLASGSLLAMLGATSLVLKPKTEIIDFENVFALSGDPQIQGTLWTDPNPVAIPPTVKANEEVEYRWLQDHKPSQTEARANLRAKNVASLKKHGRGRVTEAAVVAKLDKRHASDDLFSSAVVAPNISISVPTESKKYPVFGRNEAAVRYQQDLKSIQFERLALPGKEIEEQSRQIAVELKRSMDELSAEQATTAVKMAREEYARHMDSLIKLREAQQKVNARGFFAPEAPKEAANAYGYSYVIDSKMARVSSDKVARVQTFPNGYRVSDDKGRTLQFYINAKNAPEWKSFGKNKPFLSKGFPAKNTFTVGSTIFTSEVKGQNAKAELKLQADDRKLETKLTVGDIDFQFKDAEQPVRVNVKEDSKP